MRQKRYQIITCYVIGGIAPEIELSLLDFLFMLCSYSVQSVLFFRHIFLHILFSLLCFILPFLYFILPYSVVFHILYKKNIFCLFLFQFVLILLVHFLLLSSSYHFQLYLLYLPTFLNTITFNFITFKFNFIFFRYHLNLSNIDYISSSVFDTNTNSSWQYRLL